MIACPHRHARGTAGRTGRLRVLRHAVRSALRAFNEAKPGWRRCKSRQMRRPPPRSKRGRSCGVVGLPVELAGLGAADEGHLDAVVTVRTAARALEPLRAAQIDPETLGLKFHNGSSASMMIMSLDSSGERADDRMVSK